MNTTIPYTYLLRHKPTGHIYYGVRWAKGCYPGEFWVKYFTKSKKLVPLYRTLFGDDCWEWEIRRTFTDKLKARDWEEKVLRRMKVTKNTNIWLNRTDQKAIVNDHFTMKIIAQKNSAKMKGKHHRGTFKKGHLPTNKNIVGKFHHSEETKNRMHGRVAWNKELEGYVNSGSFQHGHLGYNKGKTRVYQTDGSYFYS